MDIPPNAADVVCSLARAATCRSLPFAGRDFDRERWFFDFFDDDDAPLVSDDASFFSDARHGHLSDGAPSDGQAALAARATRRVLAASGRGNVFDADPSAAAAARRRRRFPPASAAARSSRTPPVIRRRRRARRERRRGE